MLKCINADCLHAAGDLGGLLSQAKQQAFDAIELSVPAANVPPGTITEILSADLPRQSTSPSVTIAALTASQHDLFSLVRNDSDEQRQAAEFFQSLLAQAATLAGETKVIITASGPARTDGPLACSYEDAFNALFFALKRLADCAEEHGVDLLFENPAANLLLSPLETRDLIDQVNGPYFGFCFNPAHVHADPLDWLTLMDRRLGALRLPHAWLDAPSAPDIHEKILSHLAAQNFLGPIIYA